jgi:hypothetical protein
MHSFISGLGRGRICPESFGVYSGRPLAEAFGDDAFHRVEEELDWAEVHVARQLSSE